MAVAFALMAPDDLAKEAVRVEARDPRVIALLEALTSELALSGYTPEQTFGYSIEQLELTDVHLVGVAAAEGQLVGVAGILGPTGCLRRRGVVLGVRYCPRADTRYHQPMGLASGCGHHRAR